jgi:hypothetical protein
LPLVFNWVSGVIVFFEGMIRKSGRSKIPPGDQDKDRNPPRLTPISRNPPSLPLESLMKTVPKSD